MWPDRVSNPGPLTYESDAQPTALRGPAIVAMVIDLIIQCMPYFSQYISEMVPEILTRERCDFLKHTIHSQIISLSHLIEKGCKIISPDKTVTLVTLEAEAIDPAAG